MDRLSSSPNGRHATLIGVTSSTPPYRVDRETARSFAAEFFGARLPETERLLRVFDNSGIETRNFCVPPEWFRTERSFEEKNETYIESSLALAGEAIVELLEKSRLQPSDIQHFIYVSSTGLATPSMDARLLGKLGFGPETRRLPVWGLGCAGGALGLAQAVEILKGNPGDKLLLINVELCGLTFHFQDFSRSNLVATALFSDGVTAALLAGTESGLDGVDVLATGTHLWPDSLDIMGWNFTNEGMQVIFSERIPRIVRDEMKSCVKEFLQAHGVSLERIEHLLVHPGGAKVLEAYELAFGLAPDRLTIPREILRRHGNCSSCTVMLVLEEFLRRRHYEEGDLGLVSALGPGFSAGNVLLRF